MAKTTAVLGRAILRTLAVLGALSVLCLGLPFVPIARAAGSGFIAVAPNGQDVPGCGTSSTPCATVQYAVNIASSGDTIGVAEGTYRGSGDAVVSVVYSSSDPGKDLTIIGGYSPGTWSSPASDPSKTVIDGEGVRRGFYIVSAPEIRLEIKNLTVRNGLADRQNQISYTGEASGGGLYCRNDMPNSSAVVSLRLVDTVFTDNRVVGHDSNPASGGGVSLYLRCPTYLEDVRFDGNEVLGGDATDSTRGGHALGGGLFATADSVVEGKDLTFVDNRAVAGSGGRGWSAHAWDRADGLGGGAAFQYTSVHLDGVVATGNEAIAGGGSEYGGFGCGGGLFFEWSDAYVERGTIADNLAKGGWSTGTEGGASSGGGAMSTNSTVELVGLQFLGNRSEGGDGPDGGDAGGGAIYFTRERPQDTSHLIGRNLVLAYNEAMAGAGINRWGGGGAVFSQDTDLEFYHVTMTGNTVGSAMQAPGLIALHNFTYSTAKLYYTIVTDHVGRPAVMAQQAGDTVIMDYTLFHNNSGNYGSQAGMTPGTIQSSHEYEGSPGFLNSSQAGFDYHLTATSAGRDKATTSQSTYDIDLQSRPYGGSADLGADEYAPLTLAILPTFGGDVVLRWQTDPLLCPGVAAYRIQVACSPEFTCPPSLAAYASVTVDSGVNSYVLSDLTSGIDYDIVVLALDAAGQVIAESNTVTARPMDEFVFIPVLLR